MSYDFFPIFCTLNLNCHYEITTEWQTDRTPNAQRLTNNESHLRYTLYRWKRSEIRNQFRTCMMMMMGVSEYSSINNATCRRTRAAAAAVDFIFRFIASLKNTSSWKSHAITIYYIVDKRSTTHKSCSHYNNNDGDDDAEMWVIVWMINS